MKGRLKGSLEGPESDLDEEEFCDAFSEADLMETVLAHALLHCH